MDRIKQFRNTVFQHATNSGTPFLSAVFPLFALISLSFDPGQTMENVLKWEGSVRWMESVLPLLQHGVVMIVYYWIAALLPACFIRRLHPLVGQALRISSWLTGGVCWWQAFIVTYRMLGSLSVVTGLLFAGVGVVPLAVAASAARGQWNIFGNLMMTLSLTVAARILARILAKRTARLRLSVRARSYSVDDYS